MSSKKEAIELPKTRVIISKDNNNYFNIGIRLSVEETEKIIELLESEPPQGEFTKYIRDAFEETKKVGTPAFAWMSHNLLEACDRIDRLEHANKEYVAAIGRLDIQADVMDKNYGRMVLERDRLEEELKAKDEALRIAKWTLFGCLAEKDDPEYKNFNVDEIVMGAKVCEQALKEGDK